MSKKINRLISFVIFLAIAIAVFYRQKNTSQVLSELEDQQKAAQISPSVSVSPSPSSVTESYEFTATVSGQKALDLVQSQVKLDLKEYDFGLMVEAVNGLKSDTSHYWALYQNGDYAKTGIADIKLEKGEKLELKYEEIKL